MSVHGGPKACLPRLPKVSTSPGQPETQRDAAWKDVYGYNTDAYFDDISPRDFLTRHRTNRPLELTLATSGIQAPCPFTGTAPST